MQSVLSSRWDRFWPIKIGSQMRCECFHCLGIMKISGIDSGKSSKLVENLIKEDTVFSLAYNESCQSQRQLNEEKVHLVNI